MEPYQSSDGVRAKTTPRDFFLHLGIIVALYVSAVSLITILFQAIDLALPDQLSYYYDPYSSGIRFAIASLIIFFPVYIFLGWLYNKDLSRFPEKATLAIRRWLVYFTLFITGLTIVIDLVMLLNNFLGGEITNRFILKVLVVLVVAGFIFTYYILALKNAGAKGKTFKGFAIAAICIVLVSLGVGFYFMGSPSTQRDVRFDIQRANDLQTIQGQIINYWQTKQKLPPTLDDVDDGLYSFVVPTDPETGAAYEYRPGTSTTFSLCATFSLPSREDANNSIRPMYYDDQSENWKHGVGNTCFNRTIDPERYPPYSKAIPVAAPVR